MCVALVASFGSNGIRKLQNFPFFEQYLTRVFFLTTCNDTNMPPCPNECMIASRYGGRAGKEWVSSVHDERCVSTNRVGCVSTNLVVSGGGALMICRPRTMMSKRLHVRAGLVFGCRALRRPVWLEKVRAITHPRFSFVARVRYGTVPSVEWSGGGWSAEDGWSTVN